MLFISIYWILYYKALKFIWPEFILALHVKLFKLYDWVLFLVDHALPFILPLTAFFIKWILPILVLLFKFILHTIWWKLLSIPLYVISSLDATGSAFLPIVYDLLPTLDYILPTLDYLLFHISPILLLLVDYLWPIAASILDYLYPIALDWVWYLWDNLIWPILDYFVTVWEVRWVLVYGTVLYVIFMFLYMFIIYNSLSIYDILEYHIPDFILYIIYLLVVVIVSYSPLAYPIMCLCSMIVYVSLIWWSISSIRYFYNQPCFTPLPVYTYYLSFFNDLCDDSKVCCRCRLILRCSGLGVILMGVLYVPYVLVYYMWFYTYLLPVCVYLYFFFVYLYILTLILLTIKVCLVYLGLTN